MEVIQKVTGTEEFRTAFARTVGNQMSEEAVETQLKMLRKEMHHQEHVKYKLGMELDHLDVLAESYDQQYEKLQAAYEETMSRTGEETEFSQEEYLLYGSYEPLTVTITHILNNKSGIDFSSYAHTGLPVEVFAMGVGQEQFDGYYDNTDIFNKMAAITGVA